MGITNILRRGKDNKKVKKGHKLIILINPDTLNNFLIREAQVSFYRLKDIFTNIVSNYHFNIEKKTRLETDMSGYTILGILSQLKETTSN